MSLPALDDIVVHTGSVDPIEGVTRIETSPREQATPIIMEMMRSVYPHDDVFGRYCTVNEYVDCPPDELFAYLTSIDVDGFLIYPGYSYSAVATKEIFMTRADIRAKFRAAEAMFRKYRFYSSPIYLEFLQGKRELSCTAWANPTRNIKGWKGPCYLITDTHHPTFGDLIEKTNWEDYGPGRDPRCENCMMHSGFETSAALGVNSRLGDTLKLVKWQFT